MSLVLEHLQRLAQTEPERVLLHDGERHLNAAALYENILSVRRWVEATPATVIALVGDNTLAWLVADLALLGLPVRVVPIPGFFSASQTRHVCRQAQVDMVLGTAAGIQTFPALNPVQVAQVNETVGLVAGLIPQSSAYLGEYEKVTFTSGSTGNPKGVRLGLATLENTARGIADTLADTVIESHLSVLPYATLLENVAGVYAPLLRGVTVHVRTMAQLGLQSPSQFNPLLWAQALQQVQPHATILVPQLLLALVTLLQRNLLSLSSFRFIAVGGGKVAPAMLQQADALNLPVFEGYGLSECGSVVALNTPADRRMGSVGKVLPHAHIRIADDGELLVSGSVMKGYLGEPALEQDEVATGDIGVFDDDGFVMVSGRKKNLFITAFGRNVSPEWVEAELLAKLPIQQVAVFGEAMPTNVAIIVARSGFDTQAVADAVAACNENLPDYARIGRFILTAEPFSDANGLATSNGRIRRFAILDHYVSQLQPETQHGILSKTATTD